MHELADLACCMHGGHALDKWARTQEAVSLAFDNGGNNKWRDYINYGRLPRASLRLKLFHLYPSLKAIFNSALWLALSPQSDDVWDYYSLGCRKCVGGVKGGINRRLNYLCGIPDWSRLGGLLVLMQSHGLRFLSERQWLSRGFSDYFIVSCLQSPFSYLRDDFYSAIDDVFLRLSNGSSSGSRAVEVSSGDRVTEYLKGPQESFWIDGWPKTLADFHLRIEYFELLLDRMILHGWVREINKSSYLMLLMVVMKFEYEDFLVANSVRVKGRYLPGALRGRHVRAVKLYENDPPPLLLDEPKFVRARCSG